MSKPKTKTINVAHTSLASLNVGSPSILEDSMTRPLTRFSGIYRRLNDAMSGMYTGVGCAGTPHEHHRYEEQIKSKGLND
jgi:hypothetical protein